MIVSKEGVLTERQVGYLTVSGKRLQATRARKWLKERGREKEDTE